MQELIKKQRFIMNLVFIIIIFIQLFSFSNSSSGLLISEPVNGLQTNSVDESLIETDICSELAQWDNIYGEPNDIFVQETLMSKIAYIALGYAGLVMYDISNPTNPKFLGQYVDQEGDGIDEVIVIGKFAFVVGGAYGLKVIDLSSPKNPKFILDYSEVEYLSNIEVHGDYIFGSQWWEFLQVIDISNPKNPHLVNSYTKIHESAISKIRINNNLLYLVGSQGIEILDISNPQKPLYETFWEFDVDVYSFDIYGLTAIISDNSDVLFYNIGNPSNITLITRYSDIRCHSKCILVDENYVFSFGYPGFICFDIENPNSIVKVNEFIREAGYVSYGLKHDEFIYLYDLYMGIEIVYIGDLTITPLSAGKIITNGYTLDTIVQGNLAYVSNFWGGLDILDIDNPTNPKLISRYTGSFSFFSSMYLENSKLYLANYATNTLEILDVSDPTAPKRISSFYNVLNIFWLESEMIVKEDIAFILIINDLYPILDGAIHIVNCTNPANVSIIYSLNNHNATLTDFYLVENHLFLATSTGLLIYEINNNYSLTFISEYSEISSSIAGVFVENNTVYLAAKDYGLIILDVSDIENPNLIRSYDTDHNSGYEFGGYDVFVENNIIYLADYSDGLLVFDGTNIQNPFIIGRYKRFDYHPLYGYNMLQTVLFKDVFVSNYVVYLSSGYSGLLIVHHDDLPTHWMSTQNIIIISITTTVPFLFGGLIAFIILRIRKRR